MAGDSGKLTVLAIKAAKPGKHFDGGGLYIDVREVGRYWRLKYRFAGKEKLLALGVFPEVSLGEARRGREAARAVLRTGKDPSAERQGVKARAKIAAANSFEAIAEEWLELRSHNWTRRQFLKALAAGATIAPLAFLQQGFAQPDTLTTTNTPSGNRTLQRDTSISDIPTSPWRRTNRTARQLACRRRTFSKNEGPRPWHRGGSRC